MAVRERPLASDTQSAVCRSLATALAAALQQAVQARDPTAGTRPRPGACGGSVTPSPLQRQPLPREPGATIPRPARSRVGTPHGGQNRRA
jgi:hypothetical protein